MNDGRGEPLREDEVDISRGTIVVDKARQQLAKPTARVLAQQVMVAAMASQGNAREAAAIINNS